MASDSDISVGDESGPAPKRIRISAEESSYALRIIKNRPNETKLLELAKNESPSQKQSLTTIRTLEGIINEGFLQDNTMVFKTILSSRDLVLLVYPPGSGKTSTALLLTTYLSRQAEWSETLSSFFEVCEFAKKCPVEYNRMKKSQAAVYISFETISGFDRESFQRSLGYIILKYFGLQCSESFCANETNILSKNPGDVFSSLMRLSTHMLEKPKRHYIVLDSCDTVFNTIALLKDDAASVCSDFTKFLKSVIDPLTSSVLLICFGVSPYFIQELSGCGQVFSIADKQNKLGNYFSYTQTTILRVIENLRLETTYKQCLQVAGFEYNGQTFINPNLCVSFLRSIRSKDECFRVNMIPRSLWLNCVFTLEDRDLLLEVVYNECEKEFHMGVGIMSIINEIERNLQPSRKLFYPLFIYGGYISCQQLGNDKCKLRIANEAAKCILEEILKNIYLKIYRRDFNEFNEIYEMIFNDQWKELCNAFTDMLSFASTRTMTCERDYNNWMFGLLGPAKFHGYTVTNNSNLAGLHPDLTFDGPKIAAVWELKYIRASPLKSKMVDEMSLQECFVEADINPSHKRTVMKEITRDQNLQKAKLQATQYACAFIKLKKCKSVKCFVVFFYLNHAVLLVTDYVQPTTNLTPPPTLTPVLDVTPASNLTPVSSLTPVSDPSPQSRNTPPDLTLPPNPSPDPNPPLKWRAYHSDGFFTDEDLHELMNPDGS